MKSVDKTLPSLENLSPEDIRTLVPGPLLDAMISRHVFNREIISHNGEFFEYFCYKLIPPSHYSTQDLQASLAIESALKCDFVINKKGGNYRFVTSLTAENGNIENIDTGYQKTFPETICKGILLVLKNNNSN